MAYTSTTYHDISKIRVRMYGSDNVSGRYNVIRIESFDKNNNAQEVTYFGDYDSNVKISIDDEREMYGSNKDWDTNRWRWYI